MKPSPFKYEAPTELEHALGLLAEHGDDSKLLAGGQSLIPLLNFRLSAPSLLIDINRVNGLDYVERREGTLRIGANSTQAKVGRSGLIADQWPLLASAIGWVAHSQIRNRGTVCGSVAHGDPTAEIPVAMCCLGAKFHLRSVRGRRSVMARDFFITHLTTVLEPDEMLVEIEIPARLPESGWAFVEFARRRGDFALAGVAMEIQVGHDRRCRSVSMALLGAADTPMRRPVLDALLIGRIPDAEAASELAEMAAEAADPGGDMHGSIEYRRRLMANLVRQATFEAAERAGSE